MDEELNEVMQESNLALKQGVGQLEGDMREAGASPEVVALVRKFLEQETRTATALSIAVFYAGLKQGAEVGDELCQMTEAQLPQHGAATQTVRELLSGFWADRTRERDAFLATMEQEWDMPGLRDTVLTEVARMIQRGQGTPDGT